MDRDDVELFERSIREAMQRHTGAALDDALRDIGWTDALDADLRVSTRVDTRAASM